MNKVSSRQITGFNAFVCKLFVCFAFFHSQIALASRTYGDITVAVESMPSGRTFYGYAEYRILLTNHSETDSSRVTVFTPHRSYGSGDYIREVRRSVVVGPASLATVSLFQPPLDMQGSGLGIIIDGKTQREPVSLNSSEHCRSNYSLHYRWSRANPLCILLSRTVSYDDFRNGVDKYFGPPPGSSSSGRSVSGEFDFIKSESSVRAWSTNWLGYSRFDGVVLSVSDMEQMRASVRLALFEYVECGGSLMILGSWEPPGQLNAKPATDGQFNLYYAGFGVVAVTDSVDVKEWKKEVWTRLRSNIWGQSSSELQNRIGIADANKKFPVVENITVPVRGLFLLVLCFAIIIGPVNFIVLSRKKKRIWLLWTVPLISIVASLSVFLYAFVAEGWNAYARIQSITILNQATQRAASVGINAFYSPLTPSKGLHFDYETEVTPMSLAMWQGGRAREIDWTNEQHFEVGWIAARVPAHFYLRKNQTRRERLKFSEDEQGQMSVLNGLGADIRQLWFVDRRGNLYHTDNIKAGAKIVMSRTGRVISYKIRQDVWRDAYRTNWQRQANEIINNPESYLEPNCYIAIVDDSVFFEQALENVEYRRFESVIIGILEGTSDAG